MKDFLTDEQVEVEIEKLSNSEYVKLGRKEQRLKYKRRQYLYTLRNFLRNLKLAQLRLMIRCII